MNTDKRDNKESLCDEISIANCIDAIGYYSAKAKLSSTCLRI